MSQTLLASVRSIVDDTGMLRRGDRVLVAVSGGQDSCALLHALLALRADLDLSLCAAHLHHGLRGEEADADAEFVRNFSGSLGLPFKMERQDVGGAARRLHLSRHEAARRARTGFLDRAAREHGARVVALGHTMDDRIETVLMNALRGASIDGLQGMAAVAGNRVRPLLRVTRAETEAHCRGHGIAFRDDPSNRSDAYSRNRIRSELLPLAESIFPDSRQALLRLSELTAQDADYLNIVAVRSLDTVIVEAGGGQLVLSAAPLLDLHPALAARAVRRAIERVRGDLRDVDHTVVTRILRAAAGPAVGARFQFALPGGNIDVTVSAGRVVIERAASRADAIPFERELRMPGLTEIPELGMAIDITTAALDGDDSGCECARMDLASLTLPLSVRNRRPGDRVQPLGMTGTRKLQDILVDRKAPREIRDRVPVVCDRQGLVWAAGYALADRVKITDAAKSVLTIRLIRTAPASDRSEPG